MFQRPSAYCVTLALLCAGAPVFAGDAHKPPPTSAPVARDRADEVFRQALAAYDAGRLSEAERLFLQAWEQKQTHDIAGNLGVVELLRGKPRDAAEHIAWALRHMPPTESSKMRKGLEGELQKARLRVGALRVRSNVDGARVTVNGRNVGKSPIAEEVFVDPGVARVEAHRDGYSAAEQSVTIGKGEAREVALTLVAAPIEAPKRSIVPGVVLGSVAGAALVTGVVLVGVAASKRSTAIDLNGAISKAGHRCVVGAANYDARCANLESSASAADTLVRVGAGVLIGAGAAAVGSLVYFVWPASKPAAGPAGAFRVVPAVSKSGGELLFSGAF